MNRPRRSKSSARRSVQPAPPLKEPDFGQQMGVVMAAAVVLVGVVWVPYFLQAVPVRSALMHLAFAPDVVMAEWFGAGHQPRGFWDRLPIVLAAATIALGAYGIGDLLLRLGGLRGIFTRLERAALAIGAGLNALSLYALAVGLLGLLHQRWLLLAPMVAGVGWGVWRGVEALRARRSGETLEATSVEQRKIGWWTFGLAAPFVIAMLLGAMLPPWDFDVREYHLQVPKEWWTAGGVSFLPYNVYGNMPLGAEMPSVLAMAMMRGADAWWWGALAGKLVMALYVPLTALLLYAAGRRWMSPLAGLVAVLVYVSSPWIGFTAIGGLNEPALAFFGLAAVVCCSLARERNEAWLAAGFFAGGAAACKYPAVVLIVIPLLAAPWLSRALTEDEGKLTDRLVGSLREMRVWRWTSLLLLGTLLGCGLWYGKNLVLTGNPVYPLAGSLLDGKTRTPEKTAQWNRAHQVPRSGTGWRYSAAQAGRSFAQLGWENVYASPVLLLLLLLSVGGALVARWLRTDEPEPRSGDELGQRTFFILSLSLLAIITAVWWLATHRIERFWIPALPLACLWAGYAVVVLRSRAERVCLLLLLAVGLLYGVLALSTNMIGDNRWFVSLAALREGAATAGQPARMSDAHRWLAEHRSPGMAVLLVGDAQAFDLAPPVYYNTCFDDCVLVDWVADRSPAERREALAERRVEFVYVDWAELWRYQSPGNYGYDPRWSPEIIQQLLDEKILEPVAEIGYEGLHSVAPKEMQSPAQASEALRGTIYRVVR